MVTKFGLNRLRRSPSSSPNPFGEFQHHACMQACRFRASSVTCTLPLSDRPKPLHPQCSTLCFNVLAQRSHKLHSRFHTALVGTILIPTSPIAKGCSFLHTKTCEFHSLMPPEHLSKTKFVVGAVPKRLDPVVHLQLSSWSLFFGDSSDCFDKSSVPAGFLPQTDADKQ